MTSPVARAPVGRLPWVEPLLWLGIPALAAVLPWAARQWTAHRPAGAARPVAAFQLTGDLGQDRLALLQLAWDSARPQPLPPNLPPGVLERLTRRQATWLADTAVQLLPLDPSRAEQAAGEVIQRVRELPERMGPEDLAAPEDTPTGRLLRLSRAFHALPTVARRARRAALERARAAETTASRLFALCLVARETAVPEPHLARTALREAWTLAKQLPADERRVARAALAGCTSRVASLEAARPLVQVVLQELDASPPDPETTAVVASLIAQAVPAMAGQLAEQAVNRAAVSTVPAEDVSFLRGPSPARLYDLPVDFQPPARWRSVWWPRRPRASVEPAAAADSQLRRVASVLASSCPAAAARAAGLIHHAEDRSGALVEVATVLETRNPVRAAALYRLALRAADQIQRPAAAKRAARLRSAAGLAAFDAPTALAVVEPLPPRLIALQLNEFCARLARREPEAALRLIEWGEASVQSADHPGSAAFINARAAVVLQLARRDPRRAAALIELPPGRRNVEGWLALAHGLAANPGS